MTEIEALAEKAWESMAPRLMAEKLTGRRGGIIKYIFTQGVTVGLGLRPKEPAPAPAEEAVGPTECSSFCVRYYRDTHAPDCPNNLLRLTRTA